MPLSEALLRGEFSGGCKLLVDIEGGTDDDSKGHIIFRRVEDTSATPLAEPEATADDVAAAPAADE